MGTLEVMAPERVKALQGVDSVATPGEPGWWRNDGGIMEKPRKTIGKP